MPLNQHYNDLSGRLQCLRALFSQPDSDSYSTLFDEFLREQEFGLALETLCDFLLETQNPAITGADLSEIEALHRLMEMDDRCVQSLREKVR